MVARPDAAASGSGDASSKRLVGSAYYDSWEFVFARLAKRICVTNEHREQNSRRSVRC